MPDHVRDIMHSAIREAPMWGVLIAFFISTITIVAAACGA